MGHLIYGDGAYEVAVEDRALAHLQIVIGAKLRRQESFFLSCDEDLDETRSTIWINAYIPLRFSFDSREPIEVNREWLEQLTRAANSSGGLRLLPEFAPELAVAAG